MGLSREPAESLHYRVCPMSQAPIARGELGFAKNVRSLHKQTLRKHPVANCRSCYKYERRTAASDTSWNPSRRLNPSPSTSRFLHATCAGGGQSYLTSYMYLLVSHRDTTTTQLTSSSTTFFQKSLASAGLQLQENKGVSGEKTTCA